MSLRVAHELGLALAMSAAVAVVLLGGELSAFAWLILLAPWLSLALRLRGVAAPALSGTLMGLGALALGGVTLMRGGTESAILAGGYVLLGLLCARLLTRQTLAHDVQAVALSLLLVLAGSVLNVSISYIAGFVVYAVSGVWALCTRQLLVSAGNDDAAARVARRTDIVTPSFFGATAVLSLAVLASALVVFAVFPRVGFGDLGQFIHRTTRLPPSVGLRGDPRALGGSEVVARVQGISRAAFERGLYLRGAVYDVVTLDGFAQSERASVRQQAKVELAPGPEKPIRYDVVLQPVVGDTLLTLGSVIATRSIGGGSANPNFIIGAAGRSPHDELKALAPLVTPLHYEVVGALSEPGYVAPERNARAVLSPAERARYTVVPAGFDAPLRSLVDNALHTPDIIDPNADPAAVAAALRALFLDRFTYSLDPPRTAASPMRTFLLEEKKGHCEYFATAFALLLRSVGIPARVVGGFQGGAWDDGVVVFHSRHAHAWVEWFQTGVGWVVDDATPEAHSAREELAGVGSLVDRVRRFWDDTVIDYALADQVDAFRALKTSTREVPMRAIAGALAAAVATGALLAAWRARRRVKERPGAALALALLQAVEATRRQPVPQCATVREAVATVPQAPAVLTDALVHYEHVTFGGRAPHPATERALLAALHNVVKESRAQR